MWNIFDYFYSQKSVCYKYTHIPNMDNMLERLVRKYDKWSDEDKKLLLRLADQDKAAKSSISWIKISKNFCNKTPRQCYDQYLFQKRHQTQPQTYDIQSLL